MDKSYKNFFKSGSGFPKFKSKHQKQSVRFPVDAKIGMSLPETGDQQLVVQVNLYRLIIFCVKNNN